MKNKAKHSKGIYSIMEHKLLTITKLILIFIFIGINEYLYSRLKGLFNKIQ